MAGWLIRTFTTDTGGKPVEEWMRSLDPAAQAVMLRAVRLLRERGVALGMPNARHLGDQLWELRARGPDGIYRIIYFHWKGRTFAFLHGFTKKTNTTPRSELILARHRRALWLQREQDRKDAQRDG